MVLTKRFLKGWMRGYCKRMDGSGFCNQGQTSPPPLARCEKSPKRLNNCVVSLVGISSELGELLTNFLNSHVAYISLHSSTKLPITFATHISMMQGMLGWKIYFKGLLMVYCIDTLYFCDGGEHNKDKNHVLKAYDYS